MEVCLPQKVWQGVGKGLMVGARSFIWVPELSSCKPEVISGSQNLRCGSQDFWLGARAYLWQPELTFREPEVLASELDVLAGVTKEM